MAARLFKDVKRGVADYFAARGIAGRTVVDVPAGKGKMTAFLRGLDADVKAFDLFTHGTMAGGVTIRKADLTQGIPLPAGSADFVLCQEGIEHLKDQVACLLEFSRILKPDGILLVTTPNISNLRGRLAALLLESRSVRRLPANEIEDVATGDDGSLWFGHAFLIGVQKLRTLARVAGFRIRRVHPTALSGSSLLLFPFLYPLMAATTWLAYVRNARRAARKGKSGIALRPVLREMARLNLHPWVLLCDHLFIEFEKTPHRADA